MPRYMSEYKVPGGKLIKVQLDEDNGAISNIKITGDFFMHPEESITELETFLIGVKLAEGNLFHLLERFISESKIKLLGATARDFATAIEKAVERSA